MILGVDIYPLWLSPLLKNCAASYLKDYLSVVDPGKLEISNCKIVAPLVRELLLRSSPPLFRGIDHIEFAKF